MDFSSIEAIQKAGFVGFKTVAEMKQGGRRILPDSGGVYLILRPYIKKPQFLPVGTGGHFKGRDPNVPVEELMENWVENTCVLYIGKATSLKTRVSAYMSFGRGSAVGHWGGRLLWQLADSDEMLVCWKETDDVPIDVEKDLIAEFKKIYGQWPYANLSD